MKITEIERVGNRKYKFSIDGEYLFFLTTSELKDCGLYSLVSNCMGASDKVSDIQIEIKDDVFRLIHDDTVINRGKRYALGLLSDRDYSKKSLYEKLLSAGYISGDAVQIIEYINGFNYLNDVRYAMNYIRSKEASKSRKYIENQLRLKGVSNVDIQTAFTQIDEEHEQDGVSYQEITTSAIMCKIRKTLCYRDSSNKEKITKVIASLLRSGYNYSDVKFCLDEFFNENLK